MVYDFELAKIVVPATTMDLSAEQVSAAEKIGHVTAVWMIDDDVPAIAMHSGKVPCEDNQPSHWWQNGEWVPVNFFGIL